MIDNYMQKKPTRIPTVSVIVPTLNEAKNLPLVLPYMPLDIVDEVILVDGQSADNTIAVARQLLPSVQVVRETPPGQGAALRRGYQAAKGDILVVVDADGSNDPREIPRFVQALIEGADLAKGSRFAPKGGTTDMPRLRKMGNKGLTKLVNFLFSQSFTDLLYGYHAFWRHSLEYLDIASLNGFEVDAAIYLQAVRTKLKVVDVPSYEGFRFYGEGKLQTFPDGWRVLRTIFREWAAGLRQPRLEPQVGFRSYARKPGLKEGSYLPMTGLDLPGSALQQSHEMANSMSWRGVERFFSENWPKVSKQESRRLLHDILLTVMEEFGASSASLVVLDEQNHVTDGYRIFGRNIARIQSGELDDTLAGGVTGWAAENRKPLIIQNTETDARWLHRAWEDKEGVQRSVMVFPCEVEKELIVLSLTRPADRPFTPADLERVTTMPITVMMETKTGDGDGHPAEEPGATISQPRPVPARTNGRESQYDGR